MRPAVVEVEFPRGRLPAEGFRCPECGEEAFLSVDPILDEAQRLGLLDMGKPKRRKLQRTGNSVTVSLDRELLEDVLGGAGPGDTVEVGRQGDHIAIRRAKGEA